MGRKRNHNEDAYGIHEGNGLFVMCDGMGGHASGEVASQLAVEEVAQFYNSLCREEGFEWPYELDHDRPFNARALEGAIRYANDRIFVESMKKAELEGMGTTVCALAVSDEEMVVAHVGDSRVYRLRDGELSQLTEDHSLINHYRKLGNLTEEELEALGARKNVIVRALGLKDEVEVDVALEDMCPGDVFLVCSDGLTDLVGDSVILATLQDYDEDLDGCAEELVRLANDGGGKDNITVVLVRVAGEMGRDFEWIPTIPDGYRVDPMDDSEMRSPVASTVPIDEVISGVQEALQSADTIETDTPPPPPLPVQAEADEEDGGSRKRLKIVVSSGEVDLLGPSEDTHPDLPLNESIAAEDNDPSEPESPYLRAVRKRTFDPELRGMLSNAKPLAYPGRDNSEEDDSA